MINYEAYVCIRGQGKRVIKSTMIMSIPLSMKTSCHIELNMNTTHSLRINWKVRLESLENIDTDRSSELDRTNTFPLNELHLVGNAEKVHVGSLCSML